MRPSRAIIAGAGLAGLRAAHELATAGVDVTLLEAGTRAGGRVWTVTDGLPGGHHGELGGEFVDEDHRHLRGLADRFGLELVPVLESGFLQRYRDEDGDFTVTRGGGWAALREAFAPLVRRYKDAGGDPTTAAVREIAAMSIGAWLRHEHAGRALHAIADALRGFFLADADDLSALALVEQLASRGDPAQTRVFRIVGGNVRMVDALVAATPARFLLQHHVVAIDNETDRVIVHARDERGAVHAFEGDAAVVALPATVLRAIEIRPQLPEAQRRAIATLRYGRATKVVVSTADGSLLERRRARAFATDGPLGAFWDASEGQTSGTGAVMTFLGGGSASGTLGERARGGTHAVVADLCWLGVPGRVGRTHGLRAATWEDDPLAGGGYAYFDAAFDPALRPLLARRAGRLAFAGEHTSADRQGYMEGALESGLRAARELLDPQLGSTGI